MALTDARWRTLEPLIEVCRVVSDVEPDIEPRTLCAGYWRPSPRA
jgi:hypothetical protein